MLCIDYIVAFIWFVVAAQIIRQIIEKLINETERDIDDLIAKRYPCRGNKKREKTAADKTHTGF